MKKLLFALFLSSSVAFVQAQSYECLVGVYEGDVTNLNYGYSYSGAQLAVDYNYSYQENSGEYMNFAAYPNSGEVLLYDPMADTIVFRYTNAVTQGIVQTINVGFKIVTLTADSLVLRNSYLLCEYERTTPVDQNCTGMGTTVGLSEMMNDGHTRRLERVFNLYGQEVFKNDLRAYHNQVLIFQYSDGTREKKLLDRSALPE